MDRRNVIGTVESSAEPDTAWRDAVPHYTCVLRHSLPVQGCGCAERREDSATETGPAAMKRCLADPWWTLTGYGNDLMPIDHIMAFVSLTRPRK